MAAAKFVDIHPRVRVLSSSIEKPELDDRSYRLIRLLDNQMEALLVHDPKTDKASAALDVHVGHMSDPKDFPGLAHALEHCLFLGMIPQLRKVSFRYQKISPGK
jgi:insulysin